MMVQLQPTGWRPWRGFNTDQQARHEQQLAVGGGAEETALTAFLADYAGRGFGRHS